MMFSTDKCTGASGTGTSEDNELFTGGGEALGKEGVASDEVASAVAAVSDEIGDILKDELVDGERADQIGAELADLSAELGLLAGLADGDPQPDFPSLFDIAMGHRGSGSGSSTSSSWSGGRNGRATRPMRPQLARRGRPFAKGKEISRRGGRRAPTLRIRRAGSDASDVGAESDSDDQWTELDDTCSSDCSPVPTSAVGDLDCSMFQHKSFCVEPPTMGQFLLPLLGTEESDQCFIRHEDILQLLASAEESVRDESPSEYDAPLETQPDVLPSNDVFESEEPTVTPEEEAGLLHYVCETERLACESTTAQLVPAEEWLMGVYHTWCEISALIYTLVGANMSVVQLLGGWVWSGRFGCHCRLCLCLARGAPALASFLRELVWALAHAGGSSVPAAAGVMRALGLRAGADNTRPDTWDLARLRRINYTDTGEEIIHEQLRRLSEQSEIANQIVNKICFCREYDKPFEKQYAVERFCKILESFKVASTTNFQVELLPIGLDNPPWMEVARQRLARYLAPHRRGNTSDRLREIIARTQHLDLNAWEGYKHRCDCRTPRTLCAEQRKQLLRVTFFGTMQGTKGNVNSPRGQDTRQDKTACETQPETAELQQGDGTGAKPPDNVEGQPAKEEKADHACESKELSDDQQSGDLDDMTDSDVNSGTASLGLSTSSSLDSASELLLAAAAAVESGGSEGEAAPGELCRTVRHLMRSIASIERLMDRVLKHCDEWPAPPSHLAQEARKRVDMGLSEVDRKLMAMYRRLPEVHRRQLQVYRKQKKLSTVCMQLVGGRAPAPPPPGSPPPSAPGPPAPAARALCPEYHLQRFKEVRRKVMHMRDQQLYYHRLRRWLEDQLRHERESLPESNVTLVDDLPRRKRRTLSPKVPRLSTAPKRKLKPISPSISKPHKILQMLKHKAPAQTTELLTKGMKTDDLKDEEPVKSEAEPPEAFPLEREYNISDTETIVGEKESVDLCKEMKECLAKFANFALNSPDNNLQEEYNMQAERDVKYPETISPPLQEVSPTTSEPMPVYTPKPSQRLLAVNKFLNRNNVEFNDKLIDFQTQVSPEIINVPLNARRMPLLVKDETEKDLNITEEPLVLDTVKDPTIYKYVTFGLEIKKAMEERQNIINSYNSIKDVEENDAGSEESALSLEQICEVMMKLDKNSVEFLDKIDDEELLDLNTANTKLYEFVENMPQILANMPEIATKLTEFANASFEFPEIVSIVNNLPDVNNEAQLTPETLKQIRELKLNKNRDSVKVTKNTAKRKMNRKIKNSIDSSDVVSTMTFELDSKDISELLKDDKELHAFLKNKTTGKEDFKDLLSSISAQVVINKVFEYLKNNKSTDITKCIEQEKDLFAFHKSSINWDICTKASTLFDNSVKDVLSMNELRNLVKSRFNSWKHYVATKFKSIPIELLDNEIEAMIDKFYSYIQDLAGKLCVNDSDKIVEKLDEIKNSKEVKDSDSDSCNASKESLKHMTKLLSTSACNTFDLLIMKLSKMSQDKKLSVKSLKFKYMDVIRRCVESQQLVGWILLDPEIASNVIQELTGLPIKKAEVVPDFASMLNERKKEYFLERLREMNKEYILTLPKNALTGDEWLVMLYRLEQLEAKLKDAFLKVNPPKQSTQSASEAEILAAKGLSKIIGKATVRIVKKTPEKKKEERATETEKPELPPAKDEKAADDKKSKNEALLAKCEAILTAKGDTHLLDSFYAIKHYITQGKPVPEMYKNHVISICSSIDAKLLDEDANIEETLKVEYPELASKDLSTIAQSSELLTKALRNAKQTLNTVAFRNMMRNGQTKSESDACDTPKSECKWTNDCICNTCKNLEPGSVCLGDIVTKCYDSEGKKDKNGLEEKKKEVKPTSKPTMRHMKKMSDNLMQQQHICRVGHGGNNSYDARDPSCSCCYCTVFGHAPPLTAPVPRHYHQARDRLRTILDKKKQDWPVNAQEREDILEKKPIPVPQAKPVQKQHPNQTQQQVQQQQQPPVKQQQPTTAKPQQQPPVKQQQPTTAKPQQQPATKQQTIQQPVAQQQQQPQQQTVAKQQPTQQQTAVKQQPQQQIQQNDPPKQKPPVQPTSKPPALPKTQPPSLTPSQLQQKQNADAAQRQLADKMAKMVVSERPQPDRPRSTIYPQQKAQLPQPLAQQQKKPEPIYDLPIHNKPTLTPQQQVQIRQQQLQMLQQKQMQQQQQQQQRQNQQQQNQQQQNQQQQQRQARSGPAIMSVSTSRESSVFSTSSGCSAGSCWNGSRAEDHRDLDALLQYIEGPSRHTDRGKKRAKKQRQKLKKLESKLMEEHQLLTAELNQLRNNAHALQTAHAAARRRVDEARQALAHHHHQGKRKGKKNKLSPAQQAKVQLVAEQLGELTTLMNTTAKEVQTAERQVLECSRQLQQNVRHLAEARALQDMPDEYHLAFLQKQQQRFTHKPTDKRDDKQTNKQKKDKQTPQTQNTTSASVIANPVRAATANPVRAATANPVRAATSNADGPLKQLLQNHKHLVTHNVKAVTPAPPLCKQQQERKQTWEQALAHINQLAKGSNKIKKSKEAPTPKSEPKTKEPQRSQSLTDAKTLSKKQRKLLAKQQAEEEERKKQQRIQQEAKSKKVHAKKAEPIKAVTSNRKVDKKAEMKTVVEPAKSKKEKKTEKAEKKGKENKPEKTAPLAATKQTKQTQVQQSGKKKNKEKQIINITPDTTIEVLSNKQTSCQDMSEPVRQASCSIMEQLSCGVQVADLKLPPGITLTRVQPSEKKETATIKSVPLWKCNQLSATPTPVAVPPPVINADPTMMMFSTHQPMNVTAPPKPNVIPEPAPGTGKSKKAKKRAKKAVAEEHEGAKMVTLRNPMFHPNLPPVQITAAPPQKKPEIRIPDPVQIPSNPCQATITPTSNGMYTIRNPLVSMMHQQGLMGLRTPNQQVGNMYGQPQYTYTNPNVYNPVPSQPNPTYMDPKTQKNPETDFQNRFMNLASFTQKNDEGYSLFKPPEENQQRNFLTSEYYIEDPSPKPVVSPNPIGTRPTENRFESNESLFANPIQRPEPIGTPLKREESDFSGSLYTPFGHEDRNVFRNALFSDKADVGNVGRLDDVGANLVNGDPLPYFQRLRVGSKLNNEVTIHHVTESKFYKGQEPMVAPGRGESMYRGAWPEAYSQHAHGNGNAGCVSGEGSVGPDASPGGSAGESAHEEEAGFGAVGTRAHVHAQRPPESSVFLPDRSITNLSSLELSEREIESFKRFDFYFEPPRHKPKVQLDVAALRQHHK